MKKTIKITLMALAFLAFLTVPRLKAQAAPETMPDGTIFDAEYYAAANPDVVAALGNSKEMLYKHYVMAGKAEGRKPYAGSDTEPLRTVYTLPDGSIFDPVFYASAYPDLKAAFGSNAQLLFQHYIQFGQKEGRQPCEGGVTAPGRSDQTTAGAKTQEAAYQRLMTLKGSYPEGMSWTMARGAYTYKGLANIMYVGYECAHYAFLMNDLVFGTEPNARVIYSFDRSQFHVGDIVRYNTAWGGHSVVVLSVGDNGITVTEGNYNSSVHWGRFISFAEIQGGFQYIMTRYPA